MILKRLVVWLLETSSEALLISAFLVIIAGPSDERRLVDELLLAFFGTAIVFMIGSGYMLSTAIFGVVWRSQRSWLYPAIAVALFITHVQFFATGWTPSTKAPVQAGGACIVFANTFAGGRVLAKWVAPE